METHKAVPPGYMTVGEVAKKMDVTVRTLQYYDRIGLLSPSAQSTGGRRLYTDKDVVHLHQILSLKSLGFSLDDIKKHLVSLESPAEVANVLSEQADGLKKKIDCLSESLRKIELLRAEVLQMQMVDFKKYADIIVNLQLKNDFYWLIKHFDNQTLDHIRNRFDTKSSLAMMETFRQLQKAAIELQQSGVPPESEQGQQLASAYWSMITEFTNGDTRMLTKLMEIGNLDGADDAWAQELALANAFLEPALDTYFTNLGINPFEGDAT